jgi:hypothetical protein
MGNETLLTMVAVAGIAVLLGIALIIGRGDITARSGAWKRIAAARHANWLQEQDLRSMLDQPRCAECPMNRLWP